MMELNGAHWNARGYKQRMTIAQWRQILLQHGERITVGGLVRTLTAKKIGAGVVEVGWDSEDA